MDFRDKAYPRIGELAKGNFGALSETAVYDVSAPIDRVAGKEAVVSRIYQPLLSALDGLHRRDILFIGGNNIRAPGGQWVASVTHYVGNFVAPLWGIQPSNHLALLRAGEFYRLEDGLIAEAKIIFDLPDLLRQCGKSVFRGSLGTEITFPAPATQDGILPRSGDADRSIDIMERMFGGLHTYDPNDFSSDGQIGEEGSWHRDMMWYGPAGIGSNFRWEGFVQDHRASFLKAFPDRRGGNHYCRFGDGNYSVASGWPSMTMTFRNDYLGMAATGQQLTLRVMDFYRNNGKQLCENWVCLDYVDLFAQAGIDLLAAAKADD